MHSGELISSPARPAGFSARPETWAAPPSPRGPSRGAILARALTVDLGVTAGLIGGLMFVASQVG